MKPRFTPVADSGLLVTFSETISEEAHHKITSLDRAIAGTELDGVIETVPAMVNLLVSFDPLVTDHVQLEDQVKDLLRSDDNHRLERSRHEVLVCYEEPFCPDLPAVAEACGLDREAVINAHLAGAYDVLMYGFAPGYAYMGGVDPQIQVPRKATPVRDVPAGAVMIAGQQCLVTTLIMPTGWSVIGRSPTQILFDDEAQPFLFDVDDRVSFKRIDRETFDAMTRDQSGA